MLKAIVGFFFLFFVISLAFGAWGEAKKREKKKFLLAVLKSLAVSGIVVVLISLFILFF